MKVMAGHVRPVQHHPPYLDWPQIREGAPPSRRQQKLSSVRDQNVSAPTVRSSSRSYETTSMIELSENQTVH